MPEAQQTQIRPPVDTSIPSVSAGLGGAILTLSTSLDNLGWMIRAGLLDCWLLSHIRLVYRAKEGYVEVTS